MHPYTYDTLVWSSFWIFVSSILFGIFFICWQKGKVIYKKGSSSVHTKKNTNLVFNKKYYWRYNAKYTKTKSESDISLSFSWNILDFFGEFRREMEKKNTRKKRAYKVHRKQIKNKGKLLFGEQNFKVLQQREKIFFWEQNEQNVVSRDHWVLSGGSCLWNQH